MLIKWMGIAMVVLGIGVWVIIIVANLLKDPPDTSEEQEETNHEDQ